MARKLTRLFNDLVETIKENKRHQDHKRTTDLARDYKAFTTGEDCERFIKKFNLREDDVAFNMRKALTVITTQAIVSRITNPERKIPGAKPTVKRVSFGKTDDTKRIAEVETKLNKFYGQRGVDLFLKNVWMNLYDTDPNAFLIFHYSDFDAELDEKITYATSVHSENVLMFEFIDNVLQYLTYYNDIFYERPGEKKKNQKGRAFSTFGESDQIVFSQIDSGTYRIPVKAELLVALKPDGTFEVVMVDDTFTPAEKTIYIYKIDEKRTYRVYFSKHDSGRVPAHRVGNIPDISTDGRTVVNLWHAAIPYLEKNIKIVSEKDVSESFHAFPQKISYVPKCPGVKKDGIINECYFGSDHLGGVCSKCNGKGYIIHTSGMDAITLPMPATKDDMLDLTNLTTYITLPIDILKWMDEHIDKISEKAFEAVYARDVYAMQRVTQTATEKLVDMQSIYDTLSPVARQYSFWWSFSNEQIVIYNDLDKNKDFKAEHIFPLNLRFETENDIFSRIERAKNSGAPDYIIDQFQDDLAEYVYNDQPDIVQSIKVKNRFNPFLGKDNQTAMSLISQRLVPQYASVLFSNFTSIFTELEEENKSKDGGFYSMGYQEQKKLIDAKVQELIERLDAEAPPPVPENPFLLNGRETETDAEAQA